MDYPRLNIPAAATCTSCQFKEDFSNYWTAVMFFRARNGTYKRVPQIGNQFLEKSRGGMTVYYIPPYDGVTKVTAFQPVGQSSLEKLLSRLINSSRVSGCLSEIQVYARGKNFEEAVERSN
jgi:hypothetical protein